MFAISFICMRVVIIYKKNSSSLFQFIAFTIIVLLTFIPQELARFIRFFKIFLLFVMFVCFECFTLFIIIVVCLDNVYFT